MLVHIHHFVQAALDPASPYFEQTKEDNRMKKTDATFVDVIHTNSGLLIQVVILEYYFKTKNHSFLIPFKSRNPNSFQTNDHYF